MTTTDHHSPSNPNSSIKTRFAIKFLTALKRLHHHNHQLPSQSSRRDANRRCRIIKLASDASMASAVGSRRAWSRALLRKIRSRAPNRKARVRGIRRRRRRRCSSSEEEEIELGVAKKLREVVPGGEAMELKGLLEETAHYIQCLTTQVQVMRNILDFFSSSTSTTTTTT